MFRKLEALSERYRELSEAIAQPDVIRDYPRWQACLKERSSLEPLVNTYESYLQVGKHISQARELTADPDLASEAESELAALEAKRQSLLDELDVIEYYQQPGKAHHLSEITQKQRNLYELMGVSAPS